MPRFYGLSKEDRRRFDRLLKVTAHVAPYRSGTALYGTPGYWLARIVIKAYREGREAPRGILLALAGERKWLRRRG